MTLYHVYIQNHERKYSISTYIIILYDFYQKSLTKRKETTAFPLTNYLLCVAMSIVRRLNGTIKQLESSILQNCVKNTAERMQEHVLFKSGIY